MEIAVNALIFGAASQFFLSSLLLARSWRTSFHIKLAVCTFFLCFGYSLKQAISPELALTPIWWFTVFCTNAVVASVWLLSISIMQERYKITTIHLIIAALPLVLRFSGEYIYLTTGWNIRHSDEWRWLFQHFYLTIQAGLMCHCFYLAIKYWRIDLIEVRRDWRFGYATFLSLYIFFVIVVKHLLKFSHPTVTIIEYSLLLCLSIYLNYVTFSLRHPSFFESKGNKVSNNKNKENSEVFNQNHINKIIYVMEQEKLYQKESFTISDLSKHIHLQDYKVRKIINKKLGYRNFNDFLNHYRVKEAVEKLSSANYVGTPILTIAMESGYKAISSFNKAFKEKYNVTPTEFRKNTINKEP